MAFRIAPARARDCGILVELIRGLAEYEKLTHLVVASEEQLRAELFGERPVIEAVIGWEGDRAVGFALFFQNYSTFLTRRGLYLEDLFVVPDARGRGYGKALILHVAQLAVERGCGRFEWAVLDWNQPAIDFYEALGATVLADWRICRLTGDALARCASESPRRPAPGA
jgi:GNAT superfamily N-acetyltransferase